MPATRHERALSLLGQDVELVDGDVCRRCGNPIPADRGRRARAVYCCDRCRRAWHAERSRERVAA
jgi:RNA polymerase-binding transcription factor DksA